MSEIDAPGTDERRGIDRERLAEIVDAIPAGRWMSYGDVAALAGGSPASSRRGNQILIRLGCAGAHPGVEGDGSGGPAAPRGPARGRRGPGGEGGSFRGGGAGAGARARPPG